MQPNRLNMKKLILLFMILSSCAGNKHTYVESEEVQEDTLYRVPCLDLLPPVDTLEKWENYPDSIIVAFTRYGIAEDTIIAYRKGGLIDSSGNYYSPAYIFRAAVGDAWIYDINGKFVYFYESPMSHSDKGHEYKP